MEIETKAASLDTLSVTIKALHVNNKLMTLAVFRQLETQNLYKANGDIDDTLELWGYVNYLIKDEGDFWVVCSKNGKLFRGNPYKNTCGHEKFRRERKFCKGNPNNIVEEIKNEISWRQKDIEDTKKEIIKLEESIKNEEFFSDYGKQQLIKKLEICNKQIISQPKYIEYVEFNYNIYKNCLNSFNKFFLLTQLFIAT